MTTAAASGFHPRLSVVMPVNNTALYLDAAVGSILQQTLADFEFIILDDGSTDGSERILRDWAGRDKRIRLLRSERPSGLVGSSRKVMAEARGSLVARMDSDDVSHPERLVREAAVLERDSGIAMVGTLWEAIDDQGRRIQRCHPARVFAPQPTPPVAHGSIMFRRTAWDAIIGYREHCNLWEDIDLFYQFSRVGKIGILAAPLYQYRFHRQNTRIQASPAKLMAVAESLLTSADRLASGAEYEPVVLQSPLMVSERARRYAFSSHVGTSIMAGIRPRLSHVAAMRPHGLSGVPLLIQAFAGILGPRLTRAISNAILEVRCRRIARHHESQEVHIWQFPL